MNGTQRSPRIWPTAVDLYSGCGAVTAALKKRHFRVVAAVDNDPVACETYRANHPSVHLYENDIAKVNPHEIRDCGLGGEDVDLLVVCAPCQPFSNQNRNRFLRNDPRARLILQASRFAAALRPTVIMFENVSGLLSEKFLPLKSELRRKLERQGYVLGTPMVVDAATYGVPQRRERLVMFAARAGALPTIEADASPRYQPCTVSDAIGDLPRLRSGERDPDDPLHFARNHRPEAIERLCAVPRDGGSRADLPDELALACHKGRKKQSYPDVYGRLAWGDVAPTLTTGCTDITRGRFAHPEDDRAITLREAALLQTFPPAYRFAGSAKDIARQIGNAVPVRLVEAFIPSIRTAIRRAGKSVGVR